MRDTAGNTKEMDIGILLTVRIEVFEYFVKTFISLMPNLKMNGSLVSAAIILMHFTGINRVYRQYSFNDINDYVHNTIANRRLQDYKITRWEPKCSNAERIPRF